jgi:hypothetical protein
MNRPEPKPSPHQKSRLGLASTAPRQARLISRAPLHPLAPKPTPTRPAFPTAVPALASAGERLGPPVRLATPTHPVHCACRLEPDPGATAHPVNALENGGWSGDPPWRGCCRSTRPDLPLRVRHQRPQPQPVFSFHCVTASSPPAQQGHGRRTRRTIPHSNPPDALARHRPGQSPCRCSSPAPGQGFGSWPTNNSSRDHGRDRVLPAANRAAPAQKSS